ncbi:S-layer glycoprotein N-glycosyltransferase AglJ [Haladaptatus sp. GCM10025707]|uniref:S-layer glycoprotein N-glycosyltransferase AglJ n=1 Tax=unclassified Haladaptatus TaxID=2622732 RepID=UPI0023E795F7|nr:S-layer glycoprotein N-glycosyltransferase AglJ [Haladaptatus sp. QDMS2]
MDSREDVCVLIPTLDEAATIGSVIDGFHAEGLRNVLVVDGHSSDGTREIAADHGARVVVQSGSGKGQAVREGIRNIDARYVLMVDGDGTYRPSDAPTMLEPLFAGAAEHVIGDRFASMEQNAMSRLNRTGNRIINRAFEFIHGRDLRDILSGYRAFTRESVESLGLFADGFGIETELAVECVKHGVTTTVVDIHYGARPDASDTNLHPLRDGGVILMTLYKLAKTNNPLFYFGSVAGLSSVVGLVIAAYVGVEYFTLGISHEALAVVSAFFLLFGMQLLMFGVLSDLIVTLNREQTRRLEEIARYRREPMDDVSDSRQVESATTSRDKRA